MEKSSDNHPLRSDDERFAKLKFFAGLSHEELATLVEHSSSLSSSAGTRVISAGESGFTMYVILSGSVRVSSGEVEFATLGPGDFFGEVALVDDGPRSADVTALQDCQFLCITRMTLGLLAGLQPDAAIHLLAAIGRALVSRIRASNQKFMDLLVLSRQPA